MTESVWSYPRSPRSTRALGAWVFSTLAPWPGPLVVALWAVVTLTIAALVLRRRDA